METEVFVDRVGSFSGLCGRICRITLPWVRTWPFSLCRSSHGILLASVSVSKFLLFIRTGIRSPLTTSF